MFLSVVKIEYFFLDNNHLQYKDEVYGQTQQSSLFPTTIKPPAWYAA